MQQSTLPITLQNDLDGSFSIAMWIISLGKYLLRIALPLFNSPSTHTWQRMFHPNRCLRLIQYGYQLRLPLHVYAPHGHIYSAIPFDSIDHTLPKTYHPCWALVTTFLSLMFSLGHTHPILTCVTQDTSVLRVLWGSVRYRYVANTYLVS